MSDTEGDEYVCQRGQDGRDVPHSVHHGMTVFSASLSYIVLASLLTQVFAVD